MKGVFPRFMLASAGLVLLCTGCASISVQPQSAGTASAGVPRRIVVADFGCPDEAGVIRVDREGERLVAFKRHLTAMMRGDLARYLRRFGVPVVETPSGKPAAGPTGWLVSGEFTRVNQGSRALRVFVGAGLGGTKMETRVRVTDTRTGRIVCAFRTTGGSNADSCIIASYGPLTLLTFGTDVIGAASTAAHGVTEDTGRTAKMIADYISVQLAAHGAIPAAKAREPKILAGPVDPLGSLRN